LEDFSQVPLEKTIISVVDRDAHMPRIKGIRSDSLWTVRKHQFMEHLKGKGMRLPDLHEYYVLAQLSLKMAEKNGEETVDNIPSSDEDTDTCLNDFDSTQVVYAHVDILAHRLVFQVVDAGMEWQHNRLRARPAVTILEY
jgi:hypothetical protein